jgi:hypothetical protein
LAPGRSLACGPPGNTAILISDLIIPILLFLLLISTNAIF